MLLYDNRKNQTAFCQPRNILAETYLKKNIITADYMFVPKHFQNCLLPTDLYEKGSCKSMFHINKLQKLVLIYTAIFAPFGQMFKSFYVMFISVSLSLVLPNVANRSFGSDNRCCWPRQLTMVLMWKVQAFFNIKFLFCFGKTTLNISRTNPIQLSWFQGS